MGPVIHFQLTYTWWARDFFNEKPDFTRFDWSVKIDGKLSARLVPAGNNAHFFITGFQPPREDSVAAMVGEFIDDHAIEKHRLIPRELHPDIFFPAGATAPAC